MDLEEFSRRMKGAANEMRQNAPRDTFKIASDLLALISSRVINRGVDADGSSFSGYSDYPLPAYYFLSGRSGKKKTTRGNEREAVREFREQYGRDTSYKNWREFHGLQTNHKDFAFTNRMWKNMVVVPVEQGELNNVFRFGSKDPEDEKVMGYHQAKYKFLNPNKSEIDMALQANKERFNKVLEKWLKE